MPFLPFNVLTWDILAWNKILTLSSILGSAELDFDVLFLSQWSLSSGTIWWKLCGTMCVPKRGLLWQRDRPVLLPPRMDGSCLWVRWAQKHWRFSQIVTLWEYNFYLGLSFSLSPRVWGWAFWREQYTGLQLCEWRTVWHIDRKMCVSARMERRALSDRWCPELYSSLLHYRKLVRILPSNIWFHL